MAVEQLHLPLKTWSLGNNNQTSHTSLLSSSHCAGLSQSPLVCSVSAVSASFSPPLTPSFGISLLPVSTHSLFSHFLWLIHKPKNGIAFQFIMPSGVRVHMINEMLLRSSRSWHFRGNEDQIGGGWGGGGGRGGQWKEKYNLLRDQGKQSKIIPWWKVFLAKPGPEDSDVLQWILRLHSSETTD